MIGQGRSVDPDAVKRHIIELNLHYLIPTIFDFPKVHVILLPGIELLDMCTTKSCSFSKRDAMNKLILPYATQSEHK